jgi:hypothetical protein
MSIAHIKRSRGCAALLRLLAVAIALACQLGAGGRLSAVNDLDPQAALLAAASVYCKSGLQHGADDKPAPHRHGTEQAIIGLVSADSQAATLQDGAPNLPAPVAGGIGAETTLPAARAPPRHYLAASFPRGPPRQT